MASDVSHHSLADFDAASISYVSAAFCALVAAPKPEATARAAEETSVFSRRRSFPFEVDVAQIRHSQLIVCLSLPVCCFFMPAPNCRIGVWTGAEIDLRQAGERVSLWAPVTNLTSLRPYRVECYRVTVFDYFRPLPKQFQ